MRHLLLVLLFASKAHAQPAAPTKITIGIYAPSVEFAGTAARLAYAKSLANAIAQNTGLEVEAQSYATLAALRGDKVDFAILDGQCYAANPGFRLLASATIGGSTTRAYGLYSGAGTDMQSLKGKKLAFVQTGCNDGGFVDNAMLESEVDAAFFGARVGKADLTAAIAEVASYKTAQAVFAPAGGAKGLTKIFDTGNVPNPAFVEITSKLPAATVDKISAAVVGFGGGGAISGWTRPTRDIYTALAGRMGKVQKQGMLANPEPVRFDAKDVLVDPPTLRDTALVNVRHHFVRPPGDRLE